MNEITTRTRLEKELISEEIYQRTTILPSSDSLFPASLIATRGKDTYKVTVIIENKNLQTEQFQEVSREELEEPEIVYFFNRTSGESSNYEALCTDEYQQAKENGFKGTIDEYLSVRDYT